MRGVEGREDRQMDRIVPSITPDRWREEVYTAISGAAPASILLPFRTYTHQNSVALSHEPSGERVSLAKRM